MNKHIVSITSIIAAVTLTVGVGTLLADFEGSSFYHKTDCANGYGKAFQVVQTDYLGYVVNISGIDCNGNYFVWTPCDPTIVPDDPGDPYSYEIADSTGYVRVSENTAGGVTDVWGKDVNGQYYVYIP